MVEISSKYVQPKRNSESLYAYIVVKFVTNYNCIVIHFSISCIYLTDDVVNLLSWTMSLLLRARVNAALTIQLFSQLFHFINQWLFNRLIAHNSSLCTRSVGQWLVRRLHRVEMWAEKQGLELAAECHLARILQVFNFSFVHCFVV